MPKRKPRNQDDEPLLFQLPNSVLPEVKVKPPTHPIWTENKAKLIERYLYYFVLVTKHGAYIDGFAGPQNPKDPNTWAAKLVLESEPRWLRQFHLFDRSRKQLGYLNDLKRSHPDRDVDIYKGDFNQRALELLNKGKIKQNEAAFCLLDQRTFECHWSTLQALATYKKLGNKVELFYFLPRYWLSRALAAQQDTVALEKWWGRQGNWGALRRMGRNEFLQLVVERFRKDLGYRSVIPWPIYKSEKGKTVMYYMIHATDHPGAPALMARAYEKAVLPKEPLEQMALEFGLQPYKP